MSDTLRTLQMARDKISDPKHWGKGSSRLRGGTFCAEEAIEAVTPDERERRGAALKLSEAVGTGSQFYRWQDDQHRTHAEVLAAFDRAISTLTATERGR